MGILYVGQETSAPAAPASPLVGIFPKTDGFIWYVDSGGTLRKLSVTGSSGIPTVLSGVAGTNTITATVDASVTGYSAGLVVILVPAATNTAAATLNLTSLGAKNIFWGGAACSGGELIQSVPAILEYDGTQFNILGPTFGTRLTNSLSSDVAINNASNYFDGPSVAQGTVGTWFASGTVTFTEASATGENFIAKLWDGTTVIASTEFFMDIVTAHGSLSLSGYITNPAGNIRISVKSGTTTAKIVFNDSGNSKDSTISVIRIG